MLAKEGVGLRLYLRIYLFRGDLGIVDSEEISKRLSKVEVACLEAELKGGRRG